MNKLTSNRVEFSSVKSKTYLIVIIILHVLALFACYLNDLTDTYHYLLSVLVMASVHYQINQLTTSFTLRYSGNDGWAIYLPKQGYCTVNILADTVLSHYFSIIHFNLDNRGKLQLVFNDNLQGSGYRRLTVLLKTSGYSNNS